MTPVAAAAEMDVKLEIKLEAPEPATPSREIVHTRSCNGRKICSCILRLESAYFHKQLAKKQREASKKARPALASVGNGKSKRSARAQLVVVKNLKDFSIEFKQHIASFLSGVDLAMLGMVSRVFQREMDVAAERNMKDFRSQHKHKAALLNDVKQEHETWSRFVHMQMSCVHKLFVQYTAYKTGAMRTQFPHWAFGFVYVDPNNPAKIILPNSWKFHQHQPWQKSKVNGKEGEWMLRDSYKPQRAPKIFASQVKEWACTLQPGSLVAVSYLNPGSNEPMWWEAQVWYVWRADGKQDPAIVYDPETDTEIPIHPNELEMHFQQNPLHVIDVCRTKRSVCRPCAKRLRTFYYCHVERGHPML